MTKRYSNTSDTNYSIAESFRYLANAKETLAKSPIEYGIYTDPKYVSEAAGIAYLSALKAINSYLISRGINEKELPASIEEYRNVIRKNMPHNGKLKAALQIIYQNLHIFTYYRGGTGVQMVKEGFANCKKIIEMIEKSLGTTSSTLRVSEPKVTYRITRKKSSPLQKNTTI